MKKILTSEYKKTFWVTSFVIATLLVSYFLLISGSVFNAVALKDAEIRISSTRSEVAVLESKYIQSDKKINKDMVYALGYSDVKTSLFSYSGLSDSVSSISTIR